MNPNPSPASALGPVTRTFKPSRVNLLAGVVLGLLLLAAGGVLGVLAPQLVQKPEGVTLVYVLGATCVTGGLLFLAFALRLAYTRVDLCQGGFRYHSSGGVDDVSWDQVDLIQLHVAAEEGTHVDPSVTVLTEQGKTYHLTANHVTRMTAFVKVLGELTSGYDNLWEVTSEVSQRRMGVFLIVIGLFVMVYAPLLFFQIAQAEENAGGKPVRVLWVAHLLYQVGGKWLAAVGMFSLGLGALGWGVVAHRRVKSPTLRHRKTKRSEGSAKAEPGTAPAPAGDIGSGNS